MKNKKKVILVILIVLLFIVAVTLLVLNQTGVIKRITESNNKEEIKKEITCQVYHHVNGLTKILVIAEDTENGIERIIREDNGLEIYCNGKTKVAYDYEADITGKESITFKMVNTLGEEIEKTIVINDQFYLDMIDHNLSKETETQKVLTVNYKEGSITKQYKIGEGENWIDYTNAIRIDDYQILETLGNENRAPKIYLKQVDKIGNEIIVESKLNYTIPYATTYKQEDTVIEGKSILACVENNNLVSGNYIFRIRYNDAGNTIDYPVELYNYNGDANYITNNIAVIAGRTYTGMGKISSEKRMLILKYNGNLTINSGVVITPTGTNETINGATYLCTKKGMLIYCAGTLTNNGTITMTAKGTVNQVGENVLLYKNKDNTYEYIPDIGANGGESRTGYSSRAYAIGGINGYEGYNRKTGGGGSGYACSWTGLTLTSARGGNGTSYSGGSGAGTYMRHGKYYPQPDLSLIQGSDIGGNGGNSYVYWDTDADVHSGGVGNPGGRSSRNSEMQNSGTGGLMVIYTNNFTNNSTITANGVSAKAPSTGKYRGLGGGSGGGSINIFIKNDIEGIGSILANGGTGVTSGGRGSISVGKITNESYTSIYKNY